MNLRNRSAALYFVLAAVIAAGVAFVAWDTQTPSEVEWEKASLAGLDVQRAPELVVQQRRGDEIWASIGYSIYRSRSGESFEKLFTVRPRLGLAWAGFSRLFRSWSGYNELIEVVPLPSEALAVFAGGDIYRIDLNAKRQSAVHRMRYYGRGEGRGVLPQGIAVDGDGAIYYGEYTTLGPNDAHSVRIYRSDDEARSWHVAYEFAPGEVRHIHAVRWDPVAQALWVGTGDLDSQSRIGYSRDDAKSFQWVGADSQVYRVITLLFFEDRVVWGPDTRIPERQRGVYWDRGDQRVGTGSTPLGAPTYYGTELSETGGIVSLAENDASVWTIDSDAQVRKVFEWPLDPGRRGPFPSVRIPRGSSQGAQWIYLNPVRTLGQLSVVYRLPASLLAQD